METLGEFCSALWIADTSRLEDEATRFPLPVTSLASCKGVHVCVFVVHVCVFVVSVSL